MELQFVDLSDSHLSGAIKRFPKDDFDFDPDWEIDPKDVVLMDKLGNSSSCLAVFMKDSPVSSRKGHQTFLSRKNHLQFTLTSLN